MSAGIIGYEGGPLQRPTSILWVPGDDAALNGASFFQDFTQGAGTTPGMNQYGDATVAISAVDGVTDGGRGVVQVATDAGTPADNDRAGITHEQLGEIRINSGKRFVFEARVANEDVSGANVFVGIIQDADSGSDAISDTDDDMADVDYIGFLFMVDGTIDAVYNNQATGTGTDVGAGTIAFADVTNSSVLPTDFKPGTMTDGEFVKLGFEFDGADGLNWYVNGIRIGRSTVDATEWPVNLGMGLLAEVKTISAAQEAMQLDFIGGACYNGV